MKEKPYDDSNWREEYKSYTSNKRYLELLENGPKQLSQAWLLGALYNEWKKMKGLSLDGVFSELPVPPFLVKEWRSLN